MINIYKEECPKLDSFYHFFKPQFYSVQPSFYKYYKTFFCQMFIYIYIYIYIYIILSHTKFNNKKFSFHIHTIITYKI